MDVFVSAFDNYPLQSGVLLLGIGFCFLILRLQQKNTFKMNDYTISEWRIFVYSWSLIFIIFLLGIYLIIQS